MGQNSRQRVIDQDYISLNFDKYYPITIFKKAPCPLLKLSTLKAAVQ